MLNTPGLLLLAIRLNVLTVEQADQIKATLEGHRFRMGFNSFQDLVSDEDWSISRKLGRLREDISRRLNS